MRIDSSIFNVSLNRVIPQLTPLSTFNSNLLIADDSEKSGSSFHNILTDLMEATQEASAVSRGYTAQLLTGTLEDFPAYMIAGERSSIMFDLNLTVRTKVIDAYNEIMKTQV